MSDTFDLVVLGSGSAAGTVASRCRTAGWSVAMIDKRPFGGTCALRGCDPKKVLVGAAAAVDAASALSSAGVRSQALGIDWPALMRFKRTFTAPVPAARRAVLARAGIETFDGNARFVSPSQVVVGARTLNIGRAALIAVGARPATLSIGGAEHVMTSDDFLELDTLPRSMAFIGGGYIAFEFAHVAARAGAEVTIVHRGKHPLEQFDPDLVARLVTRTRELGVTVHLGAEVRRVERSASGLAVVFASHGGESAIGTDLVVHGAGRVPDVDDLGLEAAGVQYSRSGVAVDEYLQSVSNPLVYAAGDCADTPGAPLTPVAGYEGRVVAANLLEGNHTTAEYPAIPSAAFTVPPIARVGMSEDEARGQGLRFSVRHEDTSSWYSSRRVGERCSAFKVVVEEGSERILGAHLLGPHADETINLFALAMRAGVSATAFKQMLWAYPTHGSDAAYMV